MDTFLQRILNALRLDLRFYSQVSCSPALNRESLFLMISAAVLPSLGLLLIIGVSETQSVFLMVGLSIFFLAIFFAQISLTYWMGKRFFHSSASYIEVQRALSYTFFWGILLNWIPCIGFLGGFWFLVANYIAARGALQIGKGAAFIVVIFSLLISYSTVFLLIASFVNVPVFFQWLLNRKYF
jgi:hypothetical protein